MSEALRQLTEQPKPPKDDRDLLTFWATPGVAEVTSFLWDTNVWQVTEPWPTIEPTSLREAISIVSGRSDVTGFLYELTELEMYEQYQALQDSQCKNCHDWDCKDKWCGLRGDDETRIIDAEA